MSAGSVLISGAGIAGPTLAYWLLREGFTPVIVERAPAPRTGGYMIDFWGSGYEVARRMGLEPALMEDGYPLSEVRLVDSRGQRVGHFDARTFAAATNSPFVSVLRSDLARRLYELIEHDVEIVFSDSVAALHQEPDGVTAMFEHSVRRRFDIVIGADGLHSRIRKLACPAELFAEQDLGYYVAAFSIDYYPRTDEGVYVGYAVAGRSAARYALRGGRSAFLLIWREDASGPLLARTPGAERALLRSVFDGAGWECDDILEAMARTDDLYFDKVAQVRLNTWSRGRVVLVGDAAYCPSLLAGQGTSFAMAGAYLLARALAAAAGDHAQAYRRYEESFKPFVTAKQKSASRMGSWFAPRSSFGVHMRNAVTRIIGLPLLARLIGPLLFEDRFVLPS